MNREDNPIYSLVHQIKPKANIQQINIGKIISVSPLLISCNGIQLDREDLLINKELLQGTKRKVNMKISDVVNEAELENIENTFKVGSEVVLLTNDNQKFILLCEVI